MSNTQYKKTVITHLSLDNCTTPVCGAKRAKSMSAIIKGVNCKECKTVNLHHYIKYGTK